jgi:hypothetical protein
MNRDGVEHTHQNQEKNQPGRHARNRNRDGRRGCVTVSLPRQRRAPGERQETSYENRRVFVSGEPPASRWWVFLWERERIGNRELELSWCSLRIGLNKNVLSPP